MKPIALLTVLVAIVMLIDGYDLQVMALVVTPIAEAWNLEPSAFGIVHSSALVGLGIGAAIIGPAGDRYGRRPLILGGFGLVTLAVLASGFTNSVNTLMVCRLFTGIGLGMTLVNAGALLAEHAPADRRALLLTLSGSGITVGAISSGLIAPTLIQNEGWPSAFWFSAGISAVALVALYVWLPPSKRREDAATPSATIRFIDILGRDLRSSTIALWTLFIGNSFLIYVLVSWLPVLMSREGWPLAEASGAIVWFQTGGLIGGLIIAALMDRLPPFRVLLVVYVVAAIAMLFFGTLEGSALTWNVLLFFIGGTVSGVALSLNAIVAIVYPTTILAAGIGFTVAVARLGAISAPMVGAALIAEDVALTSFMLLQLLPVAVCIGAVLVLHRSTVST